MARVSEPSRFKCMASAFRILDFGLGLTFKDFGTNRETHNDNARCSVRDGSVRRVLTSVRVFED